MVLLTLRELAERWRVSRDRVVLVAAKAGVPILSLGYRTKRVRQRDVELAEERMASRGEVMLRAIR